MQRDVHGRSMSIYVFSQSCWQAWYLALNHLEYYQGDDSIVLICLAQVVIQETCVERLVVNDLNQMIMM